jgi:branched-chain amino acid transport system substrate-binding protein
VGDKTSGLAISQIVPYPWSEVDAVSRDYRQLAERAKVDVGYLSYEGYVNALVMIEALRRTGRDLTRAKLHATLQDHEAARGQHGDRLHRAPATRARASSRWCA